MSEIIIVSDALELRAVEEQHVPPSASVGA